MGRIKTSFVKHVSQGLYQKYAEEFSTDFSKNKEIVSRLIDVKSKKLRNIIAGYITSLKKQSS